MRTTYKNWKTIEVLGQIFLLFRVNQKKKSMPLIERELRMPDNTLLSKFPDAILYGTNYNAETFIFNLYNSIWSATSYSASTCTFY